MATNNADWMPVYPSTVAAQSAALLATSRTMVAPLHPITGAAGAAVATSALISPASISQITVLQLGQNILSIPGSLLAPPFASVPVGLSTNLPTSGTSGVQPVYYPVQGVRFAPNTETSVYFVFKVPTDLPISNLTFEMTMSLDSNPYNSDLSGRSAYFGVTIGKIQSGISTLDNSILPSSTEFLGSTGTLPTTSGVCFTVYLAVSLGQTNGVIPGSLVLARITRHGTNMSLDTNEGQIYLVYLDITTG